MQCSGMCVGKDCTTIFRPREIMRLRTKLGQSRASFDELLNKQADFVYSSTIFLISMSIVQIMLVRQFLTIHRAWKSKRKARPVYDVGEEEIYMLTRRKKSFAKQISRLVKICTLVNTGSLTACAVAWSKNDFSSKDLFKSGTLWLEATTFLLHLILARDLHRHEVQFIWPWRKTGLETTHR